MAPDKVLLQSPKFTVVQREFPSGTSTVICHPGAVVILPLITESQICLIRNHRKAVGQQLLELPAGTIESAEPPLETAKRELTEETGYTAQHLQPLFEFYVSPGIMNERMFAFVASELKPGKQNLMDDEEIEVLSASIDEALAWIKEGQIQDAKTIATLLYYQQFGLEIEPIE